MISRRKFLTAASLAATSLSVLPIDTIAKTHSKLKRFGFISNVLKNEFEAGDWQQVLKQVADLGYTEYEGGVKGDDPKAFTSFLNEIGMTFIAGGIGMTDDMEAAKVKFDELKGLGAKYVVTYWPWFVGAPFKLEDCKKSAPILNQLGELAKERDLGFCWHNHDKEFYKMDSDQMPFDYLMNNTDEDLVNVELDIYWVKKGGVDLLQVLKKYSGRVKIMHVKDMAEGTNQDFACPGEGIIDFAPIFAEGKKQKIKHYFVERDNVQDGMACLKTSSQYLKKLKF